jgi:hypothetical protein
MINIPAASSQSLLLERIPARAFRGFAASIALSLLFITRYFTPELVIALTKDFWPTINIINTGSAAIVVIAINFP